MPTIHSTAVISSTAVIGRDVAVGPFVVIEDDAVIGDGCQIQSHAIVKSGTRLGCRNEIGHGACLGGLPQHTRLGEHCGSLEIGDDNTIREYVTIHRGMQPTTATRLGSRNLIMVGSHIAHDCHLGDELIMANNVMLAGHVAVGDFAYLSGAVGVHQFCRIGCHSMVGGQAHVAQDVPPAVTVDGKSNLVVGLNQIGLRRRGVSRAVISQLKQLYRAFYHAAVPRGEALAAIEQQLQVGQWDALAIEFLKFVQSTSRGVVPERTRRRHLALKLFAGESDDHASAERRQPTGSGSAGSTALRRAQ